LRKLIPFLILLLVAPLYAGNNAQERALIIDTLDYRVDVDHRFDKLDPDATYGNWHGTTATLYARQSAKFVPFITAGFSDRDISGTDNYYGAGAYTLLTEGVMSYTAFTKGSESDFVPDIRVDQFIHLIDGPLTIIAGGGYVKSYRGHEDCMISFGPRYWKEKLILEFSHTINYSSPGGHRSESDLVTFGYGSEGTSWIFLTYKTGNEKYTATYVDPHEDVYHDVTEINANFSRWLAPTWGLKLTASYLNLSPQDDGYKKHSAGIGFFKEF
jgi:YaiO family outer membrane protein